VEYSSIILLFLAGQVLDENKNGWAIAEKTDGYHTFLFLAGICGMCIDL